MIKYRKANKNLLVCFCRLIKDQKSHTLQSVLQVNSTWRNITYMYMYITQVLLEVTCTSTLP